MGHWQPLAWNFSLHGILLSIAPCTDMPQARGNQAHEQPRTTRVPHEAGQQAKANRLPQLIQPMSCGCLPAQEEWELSVSDLLSESQGSLAGFLGSHHCPEVGHCLLHNLWAVYGDDRHLQTRCMLWTHICPLGAL